MSITADKKQELIQKSRLTRTLDATDDQQQIREFQQVAEYLHLFCLQGCGEVQIVDLIYGKGVFVNAVNGKCILECECRLIGCFHVETPGCGARSQCRMSECPPCRFERYGQRAKVQKCLSSPLSG